MNPDATYKRIDLLVTFGTNAASQLRAAFDGISYTPQKVPTMYTALTAPAKYVMNPAIYGPNSNAFVLPHNALVEVVIANHNYNAHPFHLHGHNFQVVARDSGGYYWPGMTSDSGDVATYPQIPMRRDTIVAYGGGSVTIRFRADNPGVKLLHCHIEWHVEAGMTASFIEAPDKLQALNMVPLITHTQACSKAGMLMSGNAAGYGLRPNQDWTNENSISSLIKSLPMPIFSILG
jgi:iron transport multicopper oxidase